MSRTTRICAIAFAALLATMLGAALLATMALHAGVSEALRTPFRFFCHGIASHSLAIAGTPMPLCARCVGLYAGGLIGIGIAALLQGRLRPSRTSLMVALAPILVDGITQALRLRESTNPLRVTTGLLAGSVFLLWVLARVAAGSAEKRDGELVTATAGHGDS